MATLLTIIQNTTDRIGMPRPASVVGSSDRLAIELLVYAKQEGVELMKAIPWQELTKEHSFTTVAADAQTSSIPTDFDRFLNDSIFNRTTQRKVMGPITAQDWQERKAFSVVPMIDGWFRLRGSTILMTPQPAAGESVYYEYISKNYCQQTGAGSELSEWTADTDVSLLPSDLFEMGIEWRWRKAKGFEWQTPFQQYTDQLSKRASTQMGAPILKAGARSISGGVNIPDGNWS